MFQVTIFVSRISIVTFRRLSHSRSNVIDLVSMIVYINRDNKPEPVNKFYKTYLNEKFPFEISLIKLERSKNINYIIKT